MTRRAIPTYRWTDPHVQELLSILSIAKSLGITVVLGDWGNPLIGGDARIPMRFIGELRNTYGYTNVRYYDVMNEPNGSSSCDFACWAGTVKAVAAELTRLRLSGLAVAGGAGQRELVGRHPGRPESLTGPSGSIRTTRSEAMRG